LELAERLHVTHQAVSRWETGESFPDIAVLAQTARLFGVGVDDMLYGALQSTGRHRDEPGVLEELAEGRVENVARMIQEDPTEVQTMIDAGPITRPSTIERVIGNMPGFAFTAEQVKELAPFVGSEMLDGLIVNLDEQEMDVAMLNELAPHLEEKTLKRLAERVLTLSTKRPWATW
jgi:transcriptional regulator with XRE-family HTH domain